MENWKTPRLKRLAQTLLGLTTERDMLNFLRDLCTRDELDELSRRWEIVGLLDQGDLSYRAIAEKTQVSTTTVTRIAEWLHNGTGGYGTALKKHRRHT